ncbi:MAG: glycerate kinase, partial [Actinomycetota bacterium]
HDLLITGEGMLDETSFDGKVVGSSLAYAREAGTPALCVVGDIDPDTPPGWVQATGAHSLTAAYGREEAMARPVRCIEEIVRGLLLLRAEAKT